MADKTATIETAEDIGDVGQETPAGLRARIERLKAALADSRIGQSCREMGSKVDQCDETRGLLRAAEVF